MDWSFGSPDGFPELDNTEDRIDEEPTLSGSDDGRRSGIPVSRPFNHRRRRSARRIHIYRPINFEALRPYESLTIGSFITSTGNWARFPNVLESTDWPQGAIAGRLSDALRYPRINLPWSRIRRFMTPCGPVMSTQAAVVWFRLESRPDAAILVMLLILEDQPYGGLNLSMIVGRSLHNCLAGTEWPLSQNVSVQASTAALEGGINTLLLPVVDYPIVMDYSMMADEPTRTSIVNNWLANSFPVGE